MFKYAPGPGIKHLEALEFAVSSSFSQELIKVTALPAASAIAEAGMVTQASTADVNETLTV
ncbi:MAG: hypothetical protein ACC669_09635 [bacterium]